MIKESFYIATSLLEPLKNQLVQNMPPQLMDDMNYGVFADATARWTGMHPAVCLGLYSEIAPYITKKDTLFSICNKIKTRRHALADEAVANILIKNGMTEEPLSLTTKINSQRIMNTLPEHLQFMNRFIEYRIPPEYQYLMNEYPHLTYAHELS